MSNAVTLSRVERAFESVTRTSPPPPGTDLVASRVIDSLALIELIAALEDEFQVELPLATVECGAFGSIARIADHVDELLAAKDAVGVAPPA